MLLHALFQLRLGKALNPAQLLALLGKSSSHLKQMVDRVKPEDKHNLEAQAAQYYWPILMGDGFHGHKMSSLNSILNYGYAVLRSAIARAVVGSGLHPAWGVFHHNRNDNFALVDDLLEPLRVRSASDSVSPESKEAAVERLNAVHDRWNKEAAAAIQVQRIEDARQAAIRKEQRQQQAIRNQERLIVEVEAARQEAIEARQEAEAARATADNAAANSGPPPRQMIFCNKGRCF